MLRLHVRVRNRVPLRGRLLRVFARGGASRSGLVPPQADVEATRVLAEGLAHVEAPRQARLPQVDAAGAVIVPGAGGRGGPRALLEALGQRGRGLGRGEAPVAVEPQDFARRVRADVVEMRCGEGAGLGARAARSGRKGGRWL